MLTAADAMTEKKAKAVAKLTLKAVAATGASMNLQTPTPTSLWLQQYYPTPLENTTPIQMRIGTFPIMR